MLGSAELGGESYGPQHAQGIVGVGCVRIQRCADDACGKVPDPSERIHQGAEVLFLKREGHRVYGEVPAQLVVFEGAVLHNGIAGFAPVGFLARTHELYLIPFEMQHGSAEVLEIRYVLAGFLANCLGKVDAAAFHYYIDVVAGAPEEAVPHESAYGECAHASLAGDFAHDSEYLLLDVLCCYSRHCLLISRYLGKYFMGAKPSSLRL